MRCGNCKHSMDKQGKVHPDGTAVVHQCCVQYNVCTTRDEKDQARVEGLSCSEELIPRLRPCASRGLTGVSNRRRDLRAVASSRCRAKLRLRIGACTRVWRTAEVRDRTVPVHFRFLRGENRLRTEDGAWVEFTCGQAMVSGD